MKYLLVDANSILNRAFYGVRPLTTKNGEHTNAVFGFVNILLKLLEETGAQAAVFAFDRKEPTFRHRMYAGYKAGRKGMPEELASQLPLVKELIGLLGYPRVELPGFEADDLLGTLAARCKQAGCPAVIATGDRDSLQLVDEGVSVRLATTKAGQPVSTLYDPAAIQAAYGVAPRQLIEVKALMGDASDNIPGVPGVGEKTALSLVAAYGSVQEIYDRLEELPIKAAVKNKLEAGRELAFLSRQLAEIDCQAPLEQTLEQLLPAPADRAGAYRLLERLEMFSTLKRLGLEKPEGPAPAPAGEQTPPAGRWAEEDEGLLCALLQGEQAALLVDWQGREPAGFALSDGGRTVFYPGPAGAAALERVLAAPVRLVTAQSKELYYYGLQKGLEIGNIAFDVQLAAYLLNPLATEYSVERLLAEYPEAPSPLAGQQAPGQAAQASALLGLSRVLASRLESHGQRPLLEEIEQPLARVLAAMEAEGFALDRAGLERYGREIEAQLKESEEKIYSLAGEAFNINSPKQLGQVLFDRLGLPARKKTKTGYSTNADVLDSLRGKHPIIEEVLNFRKLSKLKSTYVDGLEAVVGEDGRIHTRFRQTETRTGRISSVEPNLQNIPVRTQLGSQLRRFFVPRPGWQLVDADYSQIELRVLAHVSGDAAMIEAFRQGQDIHTLTAARVFNLPPEFVTSQMRSRAKAVNFGIVYGIGSFSLAQDIGVSVAEADQYIKEYLNNYSGVRRYMEQTVEFGREHGYVQTLYHRTRPLPELKSSNKVTQAFGRRVAMNTPIQGTAADIIKLAMVRVYARLKREHLSARLILQVHDELIVEAPPEEVPAVQQLLTEEMENAAQLQVPLVAEAKAGASWFDAK